ncbi:TadE/TadG family type IV pilus assembly protein [Gilvimarinus sp. 1_MG-2023]|uniref:TadE/TadG family type IV pilus assembly protein n=1 Tax=Gilvimarinus sp. 1_MG-2023 TaxID=3062638 RepID=UPI0026E32EAE|nr:pilus assembly protein TadG-related protein [Gilvimarinus sp. 1_MG-2023]MDO6748350.1 pilus assembly protein TadG-related protein [Gilvimarinus sp. 1_MG-2023]
MNSLKSDRGQAFIFGLLFLAVVVMALLILYNQGQLVTNRMQLENAADATVYSQAKLAARNQNFAAYTNRAMVANEVSIGQMVSLLSWAKHYQQVGSFTSFPLYRFPVAPPSPATFTDVLNTVTSPYQAMGSVVASTAKPMVERWPTVVSYFNSTIGVFQNMFALATLASQVEVGMGVVEDHEDDPDNPEMYIPVIGWYFFTQNALLTYFGENFSPTNLANLVENATADQDWSADATDLTSDFLGGQVGELENMINANSPGLSKRRDSNSSDGADANVNTGDQAEANAVEAYQRYMAIVNRNRASFTEDRHWQLWANIPDLIPEITLPLGIVTLTIDLDFAVGAGFKNDGGTVYMSNSAIESDQDIAKINWSAIDVLSFGLEFDIGLYVEVELCLPIVGCNSWVLLDFDFFLSAGFPLAGATHQVVADDSHAKEFLTDWGRPFNNDTGKFGGDDSADNNGALDGFHALTLNWGQISPTLLPGMYGANTTLDVTDTYAGPPAFFSLGGSFQESGVGYEFTTALAKSLDDIETSDHDSIGVNSDDAQWNSGEIQYTNFDVQTRSRAEGDDLAANYQQFIWNDDRPMMTISSAETYFANPMQTLSDGSAEPASLFSPFWDARLREPSAIAILLATGEVDFEEMFAGLGNSAVDMVDWLLRAVGDRLVDAGVEFMMDQVESPWGDLIEDPVRDGATQVKDAAVDEIIVELEEFLP